MVFDLSCFNRSCIFELCVLQRLSCNANSCNFCLNKTQVPYIVLTAREGIVIHTDQTLFAVPGLKITVGYRIISDPF